MNLINQTLNKYTGVYSCPDPIEHFKIRVKIKEIADYKLATESDLLENWETNVFYWQEKVFNNFEKQYYTDETYCSSELEKKYNVMLKNLPNNSESKLLFTYVAEDNTSFLNENNTNVNAIANQKLMKPEGTLEEVIDDFDEFNYEKFLIKATDNSTQSNNYEVMYIMADFGEYIGQNWVKFEQIICTLKYNEEKSILCVFPDFNQNIPYSIDITMDNTKKYYYFIENASDKPPKDLEFKEEMVAKKIIDYRNNLYNPLALTEFEFPAKNKLVVYVFLEITRGFDFEYDDIFVEYFVDLPEKWSCKDVESLKGVTQISGTKKGENAVYFGHHIDLVLEYDIQDFHDSGIPKYPHVYFEVISKDSWDRFRCEGLTYYCLPITKAGLYEKELHCFRLSEGRTDELRRFFIGDCSNYEDITWIGVPSNHEGNFINKFNGRTISTGKLNVRMNIMHQSQAFLSKYNEESVLKCREKMIFEKLNSSSLVKSVEQVLEAFRTARKNIIEARKNLI